MNELCSIDPELAIKRADIGDPSPRFRPKGFETLLQAIVGQQISTKAAASVWKRLVELLEPEVTAHQLNTFTREEIQACGLSWRKVDYALGLSAAIVSGQLDFDLLEQSDDDAATKMITTLKGFGPWSAEIYLMFAEGRRDICPSADLAIQIGYQRLKNLKEKPTAKELITFLEPWRPHRSAGCLFLWHLYGSTSLD